MVAKEANQKLDSAFECVRPMFIQPGFLCKVARLSKPWTQWAATLRGRNHGQTFRERTQRRFSFEICGTEEEKWPGQKRMQYAASRISTEVRLS